MLDDALLLEVVEEVNRKFSRRTYEKLLVDLDLFLLSTLKDNDEISGLTKYDLILETLRSTQYQYEIIYGLYKRHLLSKEMYNRLVQAGIDFGEEEVISDAIMADIQKDTEAKPPSKLTNAKIKAKPVDELRVEKSKPTKSKKTKYSWSKVVGVLTLVLTLAGAIAAIVSGLNDTLSLRDRYVTNKAPIPATAINTVIDPIIEYFPLFVGSTRTYTVGNSTPQVGGGDGLVEFISNYTEKVIMVESSPYDAIHIYKAEQTGEIYDLDCTGWSTIQGPKNKWYITYDTNLYVACDEAEKNRVVDSLYSQYFLKTSVSNPALTLSRIVFPLAKDSKWDWISGTPTLLEHSDNMYVWWVEAKVNLTTPAGQFDDCYKISLYTYSDSSFKYLCKGVGIVALEYHHHGSPVNYRVELSSYSSTGKP
jgi:hypothetical protein